jgi:hypothetical protein
MPVPELVRRQRHQLPAEARERRILPTARTERSTRSPATQSAQEARPGSTGEAREEDPAESDRGPRALAQPLRRGQGLRGVVRRRHHSADVGEGRPAARDEGAAGGLQGEHRRRHPRPPQSDEGRSPQRPGADLPGCHHAGRSEQPVRTAQPGPQSRSLADLLRRRRAARRSSRPQDHRLPSKRRQ